MLDTAGKIWWKFQEFLKRLNDLEDDTEEAKKEVGYLRKDLELLQKGTKLGETIQAHQSLKITALEARIKKLESEKHGLAISAGKAKAKAAKLEAQNKH
jgi:chromosome segregation ATPase